MEVSSTISFFCLGVDGRKLLEAEKAFWGGDDVLDSHDGDTIAEGLVREHLLGIILEKGVVQYAPAKKELLDLCGIAWAEKGVPEKFDGIWSEIGGYKNLTLPELREKMRHLEFQAAQEE